MKREKSGISTLLPWKRTEKKKPIQCVHFTQRNALFYSKLTLISVRWLSVVQALTSNDLVFAKCLPNIEPIVFPPPTVTVAHDTCTKPTFTHSHARKHQRTHARTRTTDNTPPTNPFACAFTLRHQNTSSFHGCYSFLGQSLRTSRTYSDYLRRATGLTLSFRQRTSSKASRHTGTCCSAQGLFVCLHMCICTYVPQDHHRSSIQKHPCGFVKLHTRHTLQALRRGLYCSPERGTSVAG